MIKGAVRGQRVYERRFDHDEALRRKTAGESVASLAREYGVTENAVWQAISPATKESNRRAMAALRARGRCERCGGWKNGATKAKHCKRCSADLRITTATETTLQCISCKEFKPDNDFPFSRSVAEFRRGRHTECRVCQTISRRKRRHKSIEATRAYDRAYKRRKRWEQMTPLQRATLKSEEAPE